MAHPRRREVLGLLAGAVAGPLAAVVHPDPVGMGMAESLARPGGNVTGLTTINLRTAKALGLEIPPTLLAQADEVIE